MKGFDNMSYWQKRMLAAQQNLSDKSIDEMNKQLRKYYLSAMQNTIKDFEAVYDKVLAAAEDGKPITPAWLYQLDRYWQMQAQLKDTLQKLGDKTCNTLSAGFEQEYKHIYSALTIDSEGKAVKAAISDKAFVTINEQGAKYVANQVWCADGKSWSQRVWDNINDLQQTLNDGLIDCVATGKKTTELKKQLMERFNVSYGRANTLVRTEITNIETQAALDRYKAYGSKQVQILVDADDRTCDSCAGKQKQFVDIDKAESGVNVPPFHPNCRCCVIPVVKTAEEEKQEAIARANEDIEKNNYKLIGMGAIDRAKLDRMIEREDITDNEVKFWKYQNENNSKIVYSAKKANDLPYGWDYYEDYGGTKEYHYYRDADVLARTKTIGELNIDVGMYQPVSKLPQRKKKDYVWYYYSENENAAGERENMGYSDMEAANTQFAQCIDCGRIFRKTNPRSNAQKRCPECQAKYRREYKAEKEKERRKKKKNK